jgi:hypothetical protein
VKLRFDRYRLRRTADQVVDEEVDQFWSGSWLRKRKLSTAQKRAEMAAIWQDELGPLEIVDVLNEDGQCRYRMYFSAYGSARVLDAKTGKDVAAAAQHSIDTCISRELWEALGQAYRASKPKIRQKISFEVSDESVFGRR